MSKTNWVSDSIKGKKFAFAGKMQMQGLNERLSDAGGLHRGGTDSVDYLVVGELASRKVCNWAKARKIKMIGEDELKAKPVKGRQFCLTGFFIAEREAWISRIRNEGGIINNTVTSRTDYLVVGTANTQKEAKIRAASWHNVKILDEAGLRSLLAAKPNLTIEQMAAAVHAHGGEMTLSLTPNDLFSHVKQMYFKGRNWYTIGTHWTGYFTPAMANSFGRFAPYMLCIYDNFFLDTKHGHARVTAVSDDGIRYELLDGSDYVWLHTIQDIQAHGLKEQKPII